MESSTETEEFARKDAILGVVFWENDILLWNARHRWYRISATGAIQSIVDESDVACVYPQWLALRQAYYVAQISPENPVWPGDDGRRRLGQENRYASYTAVWHHNEMFQWHHQQALKVELRTEEGVWLTDTGGSLIFLAFREKEEP